MTRSAILLLLALMFPLRMAVASVDQARKDYQFQFDTYRSKYTEFQVAKNEYKKFGTLVAQTTALEKTKTMLAQRDQMLHSYLTLLAEKLAEDQGLGSNSKQLYITLIQNELNFLERHAQLIPSIGSLDDAEDVSGELEGHYKVLSISIRQILTGLSIGQLSILAGKFDAALRDTQTVMTTVAGSFSPQKQQTINRWVLQIQNKRSFYQQKIDSIMSLNAQLEAGDISELDSKFSVLQQQVAEARQYLVEGATFMTELKTAIKYAD